MIRFSYFFAFGVGFVMYLLSLKQLNAYLYFSIAAILMIIYAWIFYKEEKHIKNKKMEDKDEEQQTG